MISDVNELCLTNKIVFFISFSVWQRLAECLHSL